MALVGLGSTRCRCLVGVAGSKVQRGSEIEHLGLRKTPSAAASPNLLSFASAGVIDRINAKNGRESQPL
jgi:hypothetical protein